MEPMNIERYEARMLANYGIVAPPRATFPAGYDISSGGVPVPPLRCGSLVAREIEDRRKLLPDWKKALPRYSATSSYWRKRFAKEREAALAMCSAHRREIPPDERNAEERERFWSVPGRTLYTAIEDARRAAFLTEAQAAGIVEVSSDEDDGDDAEEEEGEVEPVVLEEQDDGSGSEVVD